MGRRRKVEASQAAPKKVENVALHCPECGLDILFVHRPSIEIYCFACYIKTGRAVRCVE